MPDDNTAQVQITADASDAVKTFRDFPEVVERAAQRIADQNGALKIFKSVLEQDAKAGIELSETLRSLAASAQSVGRPVADAAKAALAEVEALNAMTGAAGQATEATVALTAAQTEASAASGVLTARVRTLSGTMTAASSVFLSFSSLVGIGIATSLGGLINKFEQTEISLIRLSAVTGIPLAQFAAMKNALQEMDVPSEQVDRTIQRLARSMLLASQGGQKQLDAFRELGVSTEGWSKQLPPINTILPQIAAHLQNSTRETNDLANVQIVAGRDVKTLVAGLKQGNDVLQENIKKTADLTQAQLDDAKAALELRNTKKELHRTIEELTAAAFPLLAEGLKLLATLFYALEVPIVAVLSVLKALARTIYTELSAQAKAASQVLKGDFAGAALTMEFAATDVKNAWVDSATEITTTSRKAYESVKRIWSEPIHRPAPDGSTDTDSPGASDKPNKAATAEIDGLIAHARRIAEIERNKVNEQLRIEEEAANGRILLIDNVYQREIARAGETAILAQRRADRLGDIDKQELSNTLNLLSQKAAIYRDNDPEAPEALQRIANEKLAAQDRYDKETLKRATDLQIARKKLNDTTTVEERKLADELVKIADESQKHLLDLQRKAAEDVRKSQIEREKGEEQHQGRLAEMARRRIESSYALGEISKAKELVLLQRSYDAEFAAQIRAVQAEIQLEKLKPDNIDNVQRKENELQALRDKARAQELASQEKLAQVERATARALYADFGRSFEQTSAGIIQGTLTLQQGIARMGQTILLDWSNTLLKMLFLKIENTAAIQAVEAGLSKFLQFLHLEDAAETAVTGGAERASEVAGLAGVGAAAAFASTAAIPIIGPALAPAAAAAALASILSFAPLASAEGGAVLPNSNTFAFLHPNEMVLPARLSQGIQGLINGGGGGGGREAHAHLHMHAMDERSASDFFERNENRIQRMFERSLRAKLA